DYYCCSHSTSSTYVF
nr:immunoglobulin light chain junction region [Macaca mulatta]MOV67342.1 immunoglobulin light chain junction region [Macaca mulatta]MOV67537.1 immunoglobulin light chain junction region [Macaca mulatta]MOV67957.1 immunoglobulin light chain junction region [Macaca mulatta]MOV68165.1 immunoglobulin light chain junction region [Macaca mulatta]